MDTSDLFGLSSLSSSSSSSSFLLLLLLPPSSDNCPVVAFTPQHDNKDGKHDSFRKVFLFIVLNDSSVFNEYILPVVLIYSFRRVSSSVLASDIPLGFSEVLEEEEEDIE